MIEKTIKTFYSKRNKVLLVEVDGKLMVKKIFADVKDCQREIEQLHALKSINVPSIISFGQDYILMTYIEGELLLDLLLSSTKDELPFLAKLLAQYLVGYHASTKDRIIADLNFRNFIVAKGTLYGVDFENTKTGTLEESIAKAIAFVLYYDLLEENKKVFILSLLEQARFTKEEIMPYLESELDFLEQRRIVKKPNICF